MSEVTMPIAQQSSTRTRPVARPRGAAVRAVPAAAALAAGFCLLVALVLSLAPAPAALADPGPSRDWPQFRGPERDGASAETGLAHRWPAEGPKQLWRRPLGEGFSGVAVAGGMAFTAYGDAENEWAVRLDPASGETVWKVAIGPRFEEALGNGPRATPTVDGDRVYVLSSTGQLLALATADGAVLWKLDAQADLGARQPLRGFASSPLAEVGLVIVELGGGEGKGLVALDRGTGEVRWAARDTPSGYASPISVELAGVEQVVLVATAGREMVGLRRSDGELLWSHPWPAGTIAMPLFVPPDGVLVSASADVGAMLLRVKGTAEAPEVEEVWKNRLLKNHFSSSVYHAGHVYGFDNGTLKCLDAATGEQRWAARGFGKGSLITADGLLYVLSDQGVLALVEATPEAYRELGRAQVLAGKTWTAPALSGGRLYLRDHQDVVCLEVGS
jgi:outer membrane protein assembly factor BamB